MLTHAQIALLTQATQALGAQAFSTVYVSQDMTEPPSTETTAQVRPRYVLTRQS